MKKTNILVIFIILYSLVLYSCDFLLPWIIEFDKERFDKEWTAWEAQGIVNYSVTQQEEGVAGYFRVVRIVVEDNEIIEIEDMIEGYELMISSWDKTISGFYNWVNEKYESRERKGKSIRVEYNEEYHYPEYIDISYMSLEGGVGVAGPTIRLFEFIPLAPEAGK